jgi:predicted transcriptional regulator of viral defense system
VAVTTLFGIRTFIDCLDADSPAAGFDTALRALEAHRKQKEKEADARHKSEQEAAKKAADPKPASGRRRRTSG